MRSLSIENWILPAVYAGHFSHIVWIKPPWCGQIQDQVTEFFVGKCKKTGTIRTTCAESYFLSETLYVPEHQLDGKKKLKFTSITLCPSQWESVTENSKQPPKRKKTCKNLTVEGRKKEKAEINNVVTCDCSNCFSEEKVDDKSSNIDTGVKRHPDFSIHNQDDSPLKKVKYEGKAEMNGDTNRDKENTGTMAEKFSCPAVNVLKDLGKELEAGPYVLDIDLDFFSTMNPFKDMYGERQYKILQELYRFSRPKEGSEKDLVNCVKKRERLLSGMKDIFSTLKNDPKAKIEHERSDLIKTLVSDLQTNTTGSVDFDLLHEAGCTCDDTELPHHVSTYGQISCLADSVQEFLSFLKKPAYITIARSSSDDYCPSNQVDMIQDSVLHLLQQLYLEISVTMDFKKDDV